jgi:2-methylisocitrate lyase-like PEP mutase family enzyme
MTQDDRIARFHQLHESGCFVIPNPWDAGSARILAQLGFQALATTSSGLAWTHGRPDYGITLGDALDNFRRLTSAVDLPISADFQGGFAVEPDDVAAHVTMAIATGLAGLSIEDSTGNATAPLFERTLAVERVAAARRAIDASGHRLVLTARAEGFLVGVPVIAQVIDRLSAFAEAGADCLFAPGLKNLADIATVVRAVAPKPVNVIVAGLPFTQAQLADAGVRRISVGGGLARSGWTAVLDAAREISTQGTFTALSRAISGVEMNGLFRGEPG